MINTNIKKLSPQASTSNSERAKIDKKKVKKFKSPDISKMFALRVDHRTIFYFNTKSKYNKKKKELGL